MTFSELPEEFEKNHGLHAYLFISPDQKERRTAALSMAMSQMCKNSDENGKPCGKCSDCIKIAACTHPDCMITGAEKTGVDDIRKIRNEAYLAPNEANIKVFILENTDKFNVQSQNALLKILEEPPKNVKFILTAATKTSILPTVRSRVCILSGAGRTREQYTSAVKNAHAGLSSDTACLLSGFCLYYDGTEIESMDTELYKGAFDLCEKYFMGEEKNPVMSFPKKREEIMVYLQVFMLISHDILVRRGSEGKIPSVLPDEKINKICTRISQKKAIALYDIFENAYLHADSFSNTNALLSYLQTNV